MLLLLKTRTVRETRVRVYQYESCFYNVEELFSLVSDSTKNGSVIGTDRLSGSIRN